MKPIYLDYAATTPLDPRVVSVMQGCLTLDGVFGNPASRHVYGQAAREVVEDARAKVAALIQAEPEEIIWTSGATESDNLAIKGAARLYQRKGKHIITMKTEHKAVLDACQHLEKEGFRVTYLTPETTGRLDLAQLEEALQPDTSLVSIMHVNNETGVMQDVAGIAALTSARGIRFHVDAAQSAGKTAINVRDIPIDLLSLAAHKVYGPKGMGALYLRKKPRVRVEPLIHGGGHEQGMRSGTLPTHQIAGMGEAFELARLEMTQDAERIRVYRDILINGLRHIPQFTLNTALDVAVPHILNMRFEGMLADALLNQLPLIAASTASACQGKGTEGSYVLRAMGLSEEQSKSSLRFSFGRFTTHNDIKRVVNALVALFGS